MHLKHCTIECLRASLVSIHFHYIKKIVFNVPKKSIVSSKIVTSPFIPFMSALLSIPGSGLYTTLTIPFQLPGSAALGAASNIFV